MDNDKIYKEIEDYVTGLFDEHCTEQQAYHNLKHTKYVVKRAKQIGAHYELSEGQTLTVFMAAWFHDVGYLFGTAKDHEERGAEKMQEFASDHKIPEIITADAYNCILATRGSVKPTNLMEEIVVDADTYNLGTKKFKKTNKQVYKEILATKGSIDKESFYTHAYNFLQNHKYYTKYADELLSSYKEKNMKKIKSDLDKDKEILKEKNKEKTKITEKDGTTKGMQTMLRLTSSNHIRLSEMADSKANILISVNAIIISVILSVLFRKLNDDPYLTVPTMIFLVTSVATIVIAITATRPKVNSGLFSEEDIQNKSTNLLFFGNFHRMQFNEYQQAMKVMMTDADYLYGSMLQDIYVLGTVLGKKYKLLRLAYTLFMIGIIVSVLAFAVAVIISGSAPVEVKGNVTNGSPF